MKVVSALQKARAWLSVLCLWKLLLCGELFACSFLIIKQNSSVKLSTDDIQLRCSTMIKIQCIAVEISELMIYAMRFIKIIIFWSLNVRDLQRWMRLRLLPTCAYIHTGTRIPQLQHFPSAFSFSLFRRKKSFVCVCFQSWLLIIFIQWIFFFKNRVLRVKKRICSQKSD